MAQIVSPTLFPPTRAGALARIAAVRPAAYAGSRNSIEGAVSRLSPYVTHGFVSLPEILTRVASQYPLDPQHAFVCELGWREYFHHVWHHRGDGILQSLHEGPLPEQAYARDLPADIRQARTGLPVIDQAVRSLYSTGYLHNHARLWLASYVVHLRKVHWRTGADWLIAHLLDGDLASNHLSWQWVAGTGSSKPYLFHAENVARYAPRTWASFGSVLDTSYEALDALARDPVAVPIAAQGDGVSEPTTSGRPLDTTLESPRESPRADDVAGRHVWLVHPWALDEPPADLPAETLLVGWWPAEQHAAWPWTAARWTFVGTRMAELSRLRWHASQPELAGLLATAASVQTVSHPQISGALPRSVVQRSLPRLFAEVTQPCGSFSAWWKRTTRGVKQLTDLPGLAAIERRLGRLGPEF